MAQHAKLSPSSSERWLHCPASVRIAEQFPADGSSEFADEGTCAHELAWIKGSLEFGHIGAAAARRHRRHWMKKWQRFTADPAIVAEMGRHTDAWVELLIERAAEHPLTQVLLEQRLDPEIEGVWGTGDAVLFSPVHVEVIDFKYGRGVRVSALRNPQLMFYALATLLGFGDWLGVAEDVFWTVHQPRLDHIETDTCTADELRAWAEEVRPIAAEALAGSDRFGPSESACRWCPASGRCEAQTRSAFPDDLTDGDPELLTPERMAEILDRLPELRGWLKAFETAALHAAYDEGQQIPGYKVIRSGGIRQIKDSEAAIERLAANGIPASQVSERKLLGVGALEKLLTPEGFDRLLTKPGLVTKTAGRESLVPESDRRQAISPASEAVTVFGD